MDNSSRPPRAVVIGGTSGICRQVTLQLVQQQYDVIFVGRNERRGAETLSALRRVAGRTNAARFVPGDVSTAAGVDAVAERIRGNWDSLDVLVNGAGVLTRHREVTAEDHELNFAVHHLAPFSMTGRLLPLLAAGRGRVVNVNSEGHRAALLGTGRVEIDFDDLDSERQFETFVAYSRTKLANLLFQLEAQRRHPELTLVALHPGMVRSNIGRDLPKVTVAMFAAFSISPESGAKPVVRLATADDVTPGAYYSRFDESLASSAARDAGTARRLWEVTEQLRGPFAATAWA